MKKKCHGIIAKHWRTRALSMNTYALRNLTWAYGSTGSPLKNSVPSDMKAWRLAAYTDWAIRQYGSVVGRSVAIILDGIDGGEGGAILPKVSSWGKGTKDYEQAPSVLRSESKDWDKYQEQFNFVDKLENLRELVEGSGNLERFDYLLKSMQSFKLKGEYTTIRHQFETAALIDSTSDETKEFRRMMAEKFVEIMSLEIQKITTASDLGEIISLERNNWHQMVQIKHGVSGPNPELEYAGDAFIKVVPARTIVEEGEDLTLNIIAMLASNPKLNYRLLGKEIWKTISLKQKGRSVYEATIPAQPDDFEYYIISHDSASAVFPLTVPDMYHTVVVAARPSNGLSQAL